MFFDLQKAPMLKRISALILDLIVLSIVVTGFSLCLSAILKYDADAEALEEKTTYYQEQYGVKQTEEYVSLVESDPTAKANYEEYLKAVYADEEITKLNNLVLQKLLTILSVGFLLGFLVVDFFIPLLLKDGRTIGKKIFGICLMQSDHTKVRKAALFARTVIGKYALETMVPVIVIHMIVFFNIGMVGTIVLILLLLLQIIICVKTQGNLVIHDLISATVCVDEKSQMIFDDENAKEEYRKKLEEMDERGLYESSTRECN